MLCSDCLILASLNPVSLLQCWWRSNRAEAFGVPRRFPFEQGNRMPQICWQTTFICGNYRGSGKPLKQLELLSRQADIRRVTGASSRQLALTSGRSGASNDDLSTREKPASTVARLCKDCRWAGCGDQSPLRLLAAAASPQAPRLGRRADATPVEQFKAIRCLLNQRATDCLTKDRDALLAFYDFPAEHWKHLRTTNPIESTFATVRHRTIRSKGCLSNKTALAMVFKLVEGAQKSWRRIDGHNQLPKLIRGVKFADGIEVIGNSAVSQAKAAAA
jgi:hypothetical protein